MKYIFLIFNPVYIDSKFSLVTIAELVYISFVLHSPARSEERRVGKQYNF